METARTDGPATCRRSAGACNATRSISTDSAGASVPSMLATSGMRRITPFAGSLTDMSPWPVAARSSSSMLGSAPRNWPMLGAALAIPSRLSPDRATVNGGARSVLPVGSGAPMSAQDDRSGADGRSQLRIVRRQRGQPFGEDRILLPRALQQLRAATAGPLPASGYRCRWPRAGTSRCRASIGPASSAATATGPAPRGSFRRSRRPSPAWIRTVRGSIRLERVEPIRLQARVPDRLRHADDRPSARQDRNVRRARFARYAGVRGSAAAASLTTRFPSRHMPR